VLLSTLLHPISYRGALLSALLRATVYVFTQFAECTGTDCKLNIQDAVVTELTCFHGDKRSAHNSEYSLLSESVQLFVKDDQKLSYYCAYLADRVVVSRPLDRSSTPAQNSVSWPSEAPAASLPTRRLFRGNVATSNLTSAMRRLVIPRACAVTCD
jgi:hypothetical protein